MHPLIELITAADASVRDRSLEEVCQGWSTPQLLDGCAELNRFRRRSASLYERVRACMLLYALHRFHLPPRPDIAPVGHVPFAAYERLLNRRYEEAIAALLAELDRSGPNATLSSALAEAYRGLAFQTLADQVRRSVRSAVGNRWMFRVGHTSDHPLRVRPELRTRSSEVEPFPILCERTPVRMDLTHSGWSDIFLLAMDRPEAARVVNVSVDLAVRGRDRAPRPPVEAYFRVVDEPVLRLASIDLGAATEVQDLAEVFDFSRDYLGLLKAAIVASGLIPPGMEGSHEELRSVLERLVGPGHGIELVSCVNGIPKGSRLAVSTTLLAALIAVCMRATSQVQRLVGTLEEGDRRIVAARAILGEWLAGSGGGWQDSGGLWPGIKLIEGCAAAEGDPEFGISRGRLLPSHRLLGKDVVPEEARVRLENSLVLVHGGMAQNVGPILEMVTEKYLLRSANEWTARREAGRLLDTIVGLLGRGDIRALGEATTHNYMGPIQAIIPWAGNRYTEALIEQCRERFASDFWGFWMLGGMSGGGMGFIFNPAARVAAQDALQQIMAQTKLALGNALPFAMDPVVYDFAINDNGSVADVRRGADALLPPDYYAMMAPTMIRRDVRCLSAGRRAEMDALNAACRAREEFSRTAEVVFERLMPQSGTRDGIGEQLRALLEANGFDRAEHEAIRGDLRRGRIGLAQNRLPVNTDIGDVHSEDVKHLAAAGSDAVRAGEEALRAGRVGVVSLAAGVGSRWTQGAGVVKALHPFSRIAGSYRTFIEVHLAKTRRACRRAGRPVPHVLTTSDLTEGPIRDYLAGHANDLDVRVSPGRSIGLRLVPMVRDLRFAWEEMPQQVLDERAQRAREGLHAALIEWARSAGEGSDYTDNQPAQCVHPVGHWYEVPNMLKNGTLADLLKTYPDLDTLMLHNIDTLGADLDPAALGLHLQSGADLTFEVIPRWIDDRGGGLARVDGRVRLVEGLAMPREEQEFALSFYNSMTTWIRVDSLLRIFGLDRNSLTDKQSVADGVRSVASRVPTYVTLKDVKRRWGFGQEDVYPVAQFEKLWGDMTGLADVDCRFIVTPRVRGRQLKDQAQLDGWLRDGSAEYIAGIGDWE